MTINAPNLNHLWTRLIVEELVRHGVTMFCVSPGSRSTPLTWAVADHPVAQSVVHFDERGAAFFALGWARATGRPAALVCTSGTAAANCYPAVVEASMDGVPLVVLTADRPPEAYHSGANQTIDQIKLYGDYPRFFAQAPTPSRDVPAPALLALIDQAVRHATGANAGPVHLNCPFREPLAPVEADNDFRDYLAPLARWQDTPGPWTRHVRAVTAAPDADTRQLLQQARRGLLVVGRLNAPDEVEAARRLARVLQWPVVADILSGLRLGADGYPLIGHADGVLASENGRRLLEPEVMLHLGGPLTSKRFLEFADAWRAGAYVLVAPHDRAWDPAHRATLRLESSIGALADALDGAAMAVDAAWRARVLAANAAAGNAIAAALPDTLHEIGVARAVAAQIAGGSGLFTGNSMPIRDLDMYAAADGAPVRLCGNRGASGIDGGIATAAGVARGLNAPVTALLGDLACLHDLNSLALLRDVSRPVVLVVVNNDGGGIFSLLPVARHPAHFETHFGTPHGLGFEAAARMFGLHYAAPETPEAFAAAYRTATATPRTSIIEVHSERGANAALHAAVREAVVKAVDAACGA